MVTTVFTDLGGVLLTNGWDRTARRRAAEQFSLDYEDMDERHHLTFDTYEIGRLSLDEYLNRVVFNKPRGFSREDFRAFMFAQSQPIHEMLELMRQVKQHNSVRIVAISNEGRELAQHRIDAFRLRDFIDAFFVSGFLHMRKPDRYIFLTALDAIQAPLQDSIYLDDRLLFVEIATSLGMNAFQHVKYEETRDRLLSLGLKLG
ncbi:MAG: HAD hydrolase-like protein [Armatimonadetes bacterium]|nr:HAD hydrolase-like protein [Armatimonadota bacterium]